MARSNRNHTRESSVRIVAGRWRGRRLPVLALPGLRPTGDRQRETLFNWLQGVVPGAVCLDLFAGSGALGLEALSRGAASLQAVELNRQAARQLESNVATLGADAEVHCDDWQRFLSANEQCFDLVFLDPPFAQKLLSAVLPEVDNCLNPGAWVYVEDDSNHQAPHWPCRWQLKKERISGGTAVKLFQVVSSDTC